MNLFAYRLLPLEDVLFKYQDEEKAELLAHWSGYTFGRYWLNTGDGPVPRVHPQGWGKEDDILVDRVAFVWEELADILPDVLEPPPEPFVSWVTSGAWQTWQERLNACWGREFPDGASSHHPIAVKLLTVNHWRMRRLVDIGYGLHDSRADTPTLQIWRIDDVVTLAWETPGPIAGEVPTWEHQSGWQSLSLEAFLHEVHDFRARLRADVEAHLRKVEALGLLTAEQIEVLRRQVDEALTQQTSSPQTNWKQLRHLVSELEAWSGVRVDRSSLT